MAVMPTDDDLIAAIGAENLTPELITSATTVMAAVAELITNGVTPASQPDDFPTTISDTAYQWGIIEGARLLNEMGAGAAITMNDVTIGPGEMTLAQKRLKRSLFWADPFPTVRS